MKCSECNRDLPSGMFVKHTNICYRCYNKLTPDLKDKVDAISKQKTAAEASAPMHAASAAATTNHAASSSNAISFSQYNLPSSFNSTSSSTTAGPSIPADSAASSSSQVQSPILQHGNQQMHFIGLKEDMKKILSGKLLEPSDGTEWSIRYNLKWLNDLVNKATTFTVVGDIKKIRKNFEEIITFNRRHTLGVEILALLSAEYTIQSAGNEGVCLMVPPGRAIGIFPILHDDACENLGTPEKHVHFWKEELSHYYLRVLDYISSLQPTKLTPQFHANAGSSAFAMPNGNSSQSSSSDGKLWRKPQ